jgi:hypothetical protein
MLKLLAALVISLATSPAWALCQLCTAEIRLDSGLADCLVHRSADALKQMAASPKGFMIVDLRDCGSRGSLPTGGAPDGPPLLDDRFVIDAAGLNCLTSVITALDDSAMTPSRVFDLTKDCPAQ